MKDCPKIRRIIVICRFHGGFGGEENYVRCLLDALPDVETHVLVTRKIREDGLVPTKRANLFVWPMTFLAALGLLVRFRNAIDLCISFSVDRFPGRGFFYRLASLFRIPLLVVPAGNRLGRAERYFDHVLWEASNAEVFGADKSAKGLVVPPPALHPGNRPVVGIPFRLDGEFFLTVFNDYDAKLKGSDLLAQFARQVQCRVVWVTALAVDPASMPPNVCILSAGRSLISLLMTHCRAYICFSASEGFGWSMFEAMMHQKPILSRWIGVATDYKHDVLHWQSLEDLISIIKSGSIPAAVRYDMSRFSPERYRSALSDILAGYQLKQGSRQE